MKQQIRKTCLGTSTFPGPPEIANWLPVGPCENKIISSLAKNTSRKQLIDRFSHNDFTARIVAAQSREAEVADKISTRHPDVNANTYGGRTV